MQPFFFFFKNIEGTFLVEPIILNDLKQSRNLGMPIRY